MADSVSSALKYGFASPHNFAPAVRAQMHLPDRVILNDLTLREGRGLDGVFLDSNKVVDGLLAKLREVRRPITDDEFRALADGGQNH